MTVLRAEILWPTHIPGAAYIKKCSKVDVALVSDKWLRYGTVNDRQYMLRVVRFVWALLTALMVPLPMEAADAVPLQPAHPTQIDWNLTPEQITSTCTAQIAALDAAVKRVMAIACERSRIRCFRSKTRNPDPTTAWLLRASCLIWPSRSPFATLRDRCNIAQSNYFVVFGARPDVYRALVDVQHSGTARTDADKKLLEYYLVSARQSGAGAVGGEA